MKGDPIIIMVRDKNCMVSVTIKDVKQKRIARLSDRQRSELRAYMADHLIKALKLLKEGKRIWRL